MYIVDSYSAAVLFCIITMIGWGSWINTLKLTPKNWSFSLYYWDYSIGLVITSLLFGITLGSNGENGRDFITDLTLANPEALLAAFLGGVIFNLSNLLIVAATAIAGMAVAFPIAVGLALVIGVVVNYMADPLGNPYLLFLGLLLVVLAILFNAKAYTKLPKTSHGNKKKGIIISILSGILMGFFYRFVADAMISDFKAPEIGLLTPYTAMFIFTLGIFISNFVFNSWFMYKPLVGEPVSYKQYFSTASLKTHIMGILGGLIWCTAMEFSLIASEKAGYAISYGLGQGATMISAAWGVFIWKEFATAKKKTAPWLTAMFGFFIIGLILIILARII
ncbi:GRP family sugar transporter [Galbibacter mesophilus]|uniref:GRP family sugar transporter n=1 Tax=Galbibacter mesophilus TaxID=379069 RepID=UPI001F5C6CCF|nr:GRP family sugar transporter [Galbibacter mesophilus]MCM5663287.1 GRP family sugar transporter [Galbibacter mesophilus]